MTAAGWNCRVICRAGCLGVGLCLALFATLSVTIADEPAATLLPWQDDASLHDLQMIGGRIGYAAGDQGMVWRTVDSGQTWQPCPVPIPAQLRSVAFVTDRIGWVAGAVLQPYTGLSEGCLFATADGGQTWERLSPGLLPGLDYVRFFSPEEGVVVGQPTALAPTGIFRTEDGGQTWHPVAGEPQARWLTAQFFDVDMGLVAGRDGRLSLIGGDQLLASRLPPVPSRAIRDLVVQDDEQGWLVGDGALVLTTDSGGVTWGAPPAPLPDAARSVCDFRTVAARGEQVWIAGSPGSVIWHSPDGGQSWHRQRTGQSIPLSKLRFTSETHGVAVGELGVILVTADGGQTWQPARGAQRRAAWLSLLPEPRAATLELGIKLAAEQGYRGVYWAASRQEAAANATIDLRDQFSAAVHATRTNVAGVSWQLPLDRPDLASKGEPLLQAWQNRAEQRAPVVLVEELVRQLRTYRPDVVILPYVAEGDALASFILQASQAALKQSGDATRALHHQEIAGLPPWSVSRVFQQLAPGSTGDIQLAGDELLPHLGDTLHSLTRPAGSLLSIEQRRAQHLAYRKLLTDPAATTPHAGGFFAGIDPAPATATRRALLPMREGDQAAVLRKAQQQRNFRAITQRAEGDTMKSAQLIAQIPDVLRDLNADQAAVVLADLAGTYRQRSQFDLAESTYLELVRRHPDHPAAAQAMAWLLTYWSSGEVTWQRTRHQGQSVQQPRTDLTALQSRIQQAGGPGGNFLAGTPGRNEIVQTAGQSAPRDLRTTRRSQPGAPPDTRDQWRRRAVELAEQLEQQSPQLFREPRVQLPLAALKRASKQPGQADQIYRRFPQGDGSGQIGQFLERELWASQPISTPPRQLALCRETSTRPHLDGVLSDPCWQDALEIPIGSDVTLETGEPPSGFVMFAYDQEFLYIAAVMKRHGSRPVQTEPLGDRDYDVDLTGFDRLGIAIDVDRDYATWYQFEVDERGQTTDRCWEDASWNPQWFVARDASAERWQLEIAIPWNELAPQAPFAKEVWGLSLARTIPYTGHHGWSQSPTWPPQWHSFGLLRFE